MAKKNDKKSTSKKKTTKKTTKKKVETVEEVLAELDIKVEEAPEVKIPEAKDTDAEMRARKIRRRRRL
jgi:hypothetical protein